MTGFEQSTGEGGCTVEKVRFFATYLVDAFRLEVAIPAVNVLDREEVPVEP